MFLRRTWHAYLSVGAVARGDRRSSAMCLAAERVDARIAFPGVQLVRYGREPQSRAGLPPCPTCGRDSPTVGHMPGDVNEPLAPVNLAEPEVTGLSPIVAATGELLTDLIRTASSGTVPHLLRPVAALREVVGIANSIERGGRRPPGPGDHASLRQDVQRALRALGSELKGVLQPMHRDFLDIAAGDDWDLNDPAARTRLRVAAEALLDRLRDLRAAQAAWRDLRHVVETGCVPTLEIGHLRAGQLRELIEERGSEWGAIDIRVREAALYGRLDE